MYIYIYIRYDIIGSIYDKHETWFDTVNAAGSVGVLYRTLVPDSTRTVKYSMEGYICGSGATLVEAGSRMCWYMLIVL